MQKHRTFIVLILILVVSLSCRILAPEETPSPGATQTPAQTEPPVTLPPATEPSAEPTDVPGPTSLNSAGPYVVYGGPGGVWISNPDGSFLTQITSLPMDLRDLRRAISPQGDRMAMIVSDETGALDLVEVKIPSGETKTITRLYDITNEEITDKPTSPRAFTAYAIRDYDNVAWQPGDGKLLAFMGAMNGATADLYVYDIETEEITQLTDGPAQGVFPNWSPDGNYILHYGVSWRGPFGGAIVGHDHLEGVWAVRVEDEEVITQPTPKGVALPFLGWQDNGHYITYDNGGDCAEKLRSVEVVSGKATPFMTMNFYFYSAHSPENGAILFSGAPACSDPPGEGTFLLLPGETMPEKLADKRAWTVKWLPESAVFLAYPEALFSSDGSKRYDPPVYDKSYHPAISQKGYQAWEVIENQKGRVEVKAPDGDWQTILEEGTIEQLIWDPASGETLLIVLREGPLYAASYPDFAPHKMGEMDGVNQVIWLP